MLLAKEREPLEGERNLEWPRGVLTAHSEMCDSSTSPWCHPNTPATVSTQSNECDSMHWRAPTSNKHPEEPALTQQYTGTQSIPAPVPGSILAGRFVAVVLSVDGTRSVSAPGPLLPKGLDKAMGDRQKALQTSSLHSHIFQERGGHPSSPIKKICH